MGLANNLIRLRHEKNLSQLELAELLNVTRQAVSKWERGIAIPSTENLIQLSKLYAVSVEDIIIPHSLQTSDVFKKKVNEVEKNKKIGAKSSLYSYWQFFYYSY